MADSKKNGSKKSVQGGSAKVTRTNTPVKRKRPDCDIQVAEGDNRKYIEHSLRLANLPSISMSDEVAVENRVFEYFTIVAEDDMKPSVQGLALALGIDRVYLWELRVGAKGKNPAVANALKKAVNILDLQMTDYMQNGKINPVSGIFLMKNNFGYTDKQEITVKAEQPLGTVADASELEQKYLEDIVSDGKVVSGSELG